MGVDATQPDYASAPHDYTELFDRYHDVLRLWAWRFNAASPAGGSLVRSPEDVDDVVSSLFEVCLRRDVLARFDASRGIKFGTFLLTVLRNHIKDQQRELARRPWELLSDPEHFLGDNRSWLSTRVSAALENSPSGTADETAARLLADSLRQRLQEHTATPGAATHDMTVCDPLVLWDAAVSLVWEDAWSTVELARRVGLHRSTIRRWLTVVAEELRDDLAALR